MSANTITTEMLPKRPNFEKQSVVFETVTGVGMGAAASAAVDLSLNMLGKRAGEVSKITKGSLLGNMALLGGIVGVGRGVVTALRNQEKDQSRFYVEGLERQLLAKNATQDSGMSK